MLIFGPIQSKKLNQHSISKSKAGASARSSPPFLSIAKAETEMPIVYDNWGRLFRAVQRRQQYLEMAHAHSRSTSSASSVSFDFDELSSSLPDEEMAREEQGLDENGLESRNSLSPSGAKQSEVERIEIYEPGVSFTIVEFPNGSIELKQVRFSRKRFKEHQPEFWWSENRENVYEKYNIRRQQ